MTNGQKDYNVLVIGGGINGLSTLYHLARSGVKKIALLEKFKIGHEYGSSHGPSRITRSAYSHEDYVRLMQWCHAEEWPRLEHDLGSRLITRNPAIFFGPEGTKFKSYAEAVINAKADVERINFKEAGKLFPQFKIQESMSVLLDHTAGIIAADQAISKLYRFLKESKAEIFEETKVFRIDPSTDPITLKTTQGLFHTERLILTAGAWSNELLPFLKKRLKVARQTVAYFRLGGVEADFQPGRFPVWIHLDDDPKHFFYGLPEFGSEGIKMARHHTKDRDDNPNDSPTIDPAETDLICKFVGKLFFSPLKKIVKTEHCLYTYTDMEDFIIDFHPQNKNILIGSVCSGHGFKFGPLTGRILTELSLQGKTSIPIFESVRKRFAL